MSYIVVLEDYLTHGRRWTSFNTKEEFDKKYSKSMGTIVAQGISEIDALELSGATPSMIAQYTAKNAEAKEASPTPSIHIAVENIDRHSGYAGLRYVKEVSTLSTDRDIQQIKTSPRLRLLAEKVNPEEEKNIVAHTPEVCLLTSAIEEYYEKNFDDDGNLNNLDYISVILKAVTVIFKIRRYWKKRGLTPQYSVDFPFVDIDSLEFEDIKRLFRVVQASSTKPNGTIDDLKDTFGQLCYEKAQIDYDNLMERLNNDLTPPFKFP